MPNFELSKPALGQIGVVGHAGCGHANSHLGFIQDDSGGLSAVIRFLQIVTKLDLRVKTVTARTGLHDSYFEIETESGGKAKAFARRGITEHELRLAQYAIGKEAICSQTLAVECFGRILGQGAMEVPVAFQTAIANAAMDSFAKNFPESFLYGEEDIEGNCGKILGTTVRWMGLNVSVLALSNATIGGLGPNEDIEGNVNLFGKKQIMQTLGLDKIPTIVIEGKVCADPLSSKITQDTFLIRANKDDDNYVVGECLFKASKKLAYPTEFLADVLKRSPTAMEDLTFKQGNHIVELGQRLSHARTAQEKVKIASEINRFASEDLGGITFMSNDIHKVMGGVGCIPGTSCVLSLFVSRDKLNHCVVPTLTLEDVDRYVNLCTEALPILKDNLERAIQNLKQVQSNFSFN